MNTTLLFTLPNFADSKMWVAILTLTFLEIILGVDNIIFVSIIANKLPTQQRVRARNIGLFIAVLLRLLMLFGISWLMSLTTPLFEIGKFSFSGQSLILLAGGLFLMAKSTNEIHEKLEGAASEKEDSTAALKAAFGTVIAQIAIINIVFSFDSILTAIGIAKDLQPAEAMFAMVLSILLSSAVMILASGPVATFINKHPTMQMLALSFLILIGVVLVAEGFSVHFDKNFIYFAIFFSLGVEILNMRLRKKSRPIQLHGDLENAAEIGVIADINSAE